MPFYRAKHIIYISHYSDKGNAVGYIFVRGKWYGPVSWNKVGRCSLHKEQYDIDHFRASNQLASFCDPVELAKNALEVSKLKEVE